MSALDWVTAAGSTFQAVGTVGAFGIGFILLRIQQQDAQRKQVSDVRVWSVPTNEKWSTTQVRQRYRQLYVDTVPEHVRARYHAESVHIRTPTNKEDDDKCWQIRELWIGNESDTPILSPEILLPMQDFGVQDGTILADLCPVRAIGSTRPVSSFKPKPRFGLLFDDVAIDPKRQARVAHVAYRYNAQPTVVLLIFTDGRGAQWTRLESGIVRKGRRFGPRIILRTTLSYSKRFSAIDRDRENPNEK